jgi:hypothetical protein
MRLSSKYELARRAYATGRNSPYSEMTDEEFEKKARKGPGSLAGSAVVGLEASVAKPFCPLSAPPRQASFWAGIS